MKLQEFIQIYLTKYCTKALSLNCNSNNILEWLKESDKFLELDIPIDWQLMFDLDGISIIFFS